ncbi:hypothetical protein SAMN03159288_01123 [Rhizobium sp. NFACC06-2]|nr:hypothetical protein SAMN03159288_01123 [Rhizobium sp. NFACC06-2]
MIGLEVKLPGGRESFIEVRNEWLGFGWIGDADDREVFLGYLQVTVSRTRGQTTGHWGPRRALTLAFLVGLAVPMNYGKAVELISDWAVILRPNQELVLEKSR